MNSRKIYTIVNSGKLKGKKIYLPSKKTTRSTKSIIKESYFNTIQFKIIDKNFIEVFAGSGSMGIEAISRGAKHAYFIEKDEKAYAILKQNCNSIDQNRTTCKLADSFVYLDTLIKSSACRAFFYFDPPFSIRDGMGDVYDKLYKLIANIPKNRVNMITIEHMSRVKIPKEIGEYKLKKTKKFGKSSLSYF